MTATRTGAQILVDQLRIHGADTIYSVPGESFLAVLDVLHDTPEIRLVTCRQEGGGTMMADAYGKLTGTPGICFVTRGPGATNAAAGVHVAHQDSTSMILFIGQVNSHVAEREAFQEIDYRRMFAPLAKWVAQIDAAARVPEFISRAYHTATSGRPGPVVLALPEDMLVERADVADAGRYVAVQAQPGAAGMTRVRDHLAQAQRPLVILGGGAWSSEAQAAIEAFTGANDLPVAVSFRRQDYVDNTHTCYAGQVGIGINPALAQRVRDADLLLVIGARLGEMTNLDYDLLQVPRPHQALIHVHADPQELGRVYQSDLAINAGSVAFALALGELAPVEANWRDWARAAHDDYLAHSTPPSEQGALNLGAVVAWLGDRLPADAIVTNGAGNYGIWTQRYSRYRGYRTQLAPTSGSMGYGLPAAVAAKLRYPEKMVVAFAGDGCFQMTMQEFGPAMQAGADVIVLVVNNESYATIRMHQERAYPTRVSGTDLVNPDFAAVARLWRPWRDGDTHRRVRRRVRTQRRRRHHGDHRVAPVGRTALAVDDHQRPTPSLERYLVQDESWSPDAG